MKNNFIILIILLSITFSFSSCNTVKYVPDNEQLLAKNTIFVDGKKNIDNEINSFVVQRPNQLVLGVPLPLFFYNIGNKNFESDFEQWKLNKPKSYKFTTSVFSEKQAIGLRRFKNNMNQWWLKNGEAPVIFDNKKTQQTVNNLSQYYQNIGFFNVKVNAENKFINEKKTAVNYYVNRGTPFILDHINTYIDSEVLDSIYGEHRANSFIQKGDQFTNQTFIDEQNRLTKLFRNSGVYRFNKNVISVEVDTIKNKANIDLFINDSIGNFPFKVQHIKDIEIVTDYTYNTKDHERKDTLNYNGFTFYALNKINYNPKYLLNSIFIAPNKIYKDSDRELTRKHLRGLKNFRSVEIKYQEKNDSLIASINLTPLKKYSIGFNTELTHSNIRQLGISGKLSFLNRNILKGAEILKFSVQGSFLDSKDAADNESLLNAWEVGGDISLELPRFFLPFRPDQIIPKNMAPKTIFTIGTSLQKNIGLDKQKFTGLIDYTWESSKTMNHSLEVFNTQFIKNLNIDSYFKIYKSEFNTLKTVQEEYFPNQVLNENNAIQFIDNYIDSDFQNLTPSNYQTAKNIEARYNIITEDVLVPSTAYTFTLNNSENYKDTDFSFFRTRIVSSGNLTTLLAQNKDNNNVKTLFKTPIAQFLRADFEYKKFWSITNDNVIAFRSFLGLAVPYGNSTSIPFSRSYFIGGPNDLRAWKIYDLGPGSTKSGLEYNVGSLKFISSFEYRFKILNSIKGALFMDAGNIWDITNSSVTAEKAKFNGLNSIKDIAIGTGFGIRYDLSFILLRLDLGFKTYEPYLPEGKKWFQNTNFKNNVYNFGISYPF